MSDPAHTQENMPLPSRQEERGRSRSPRRRENEDRPRRKDAGFRWKEKRKHEPDFRNGEQEQGLRRGYKDHYRPRSRSPRRQDRTFEKATATQELEKAEKGEEAEKAEKKEKKEKKTMAAVPQEPMIIVNVNDRLGTRAAVPCLASDPVKLFKAMVAARIGREPHEILLKRQGERPFKDQLTLADYGVSNGVQLDL